MGFPEQYLAAIVIAAFAFLAGTGFGLWLGEKVEPPQTPLIPSGSRDEIDWDNAS